MKKSAKISFRFAMFMAILVPLFWMTAYQPAQAGQTKETVVSNPQKSTEMNKIILAGTIRIGKPSKVGADETCPSMYFVLSMTSDGNVTLSCSDYRVKKTDADVLQPPFELAKSILKSLQAKWPKVELSSGDQVITFEPLKMEKKAKLIDEGQKILTTIEKALPLGSKATIEKY